jgi:hypothetical protein
MVTVELIKPVGDAAAIGTALGTLISFLPPVAALVSLVWTAMRIYEMIEGVPFHQTPFANQFRSMFK